MISIINIYFTLIKNDKILGDKTNVYIINIYMHNVYVITVKRFGFFTFMENYIFLTCSDSNSFINHNQKPI